MSTYGLQKGAVAALQKSGFKVTKQRELIIDLLTKSKKALSPYEMKNLLKKSGIHADVVTIYRVLEVLEKLGLAHKVLAFNGYISCGTKYTGSCHHYLLCKNCHRVDEVEGEDLSSIQKRITQNHKFTIASHYLEFIGLCEPCQLLEKRQKPVAQKE